MGAAWLLDAKSFHDELSGLFATPDGQVPVERIWDRARTVGGDTDPEVRHYLATVEVRPTEEWTASVDDAVLAECYRVLMVPHLRPTPGLQSPGAVKDRLPDLGWARVDARRLAFGRELCTLAEGYADAACAATLSSVLPVGAKGWLSQADITAYLDALPHLDSAAVRARQNLVPVVEDVHHVLEHAAASPERVLLLPPG